MTPNRTGFWPWRCDEIDKDEIRKGSVTDNSERDNYCEMIRRASRGKYFCTEIRPRAFSLRRMTKSPWNSTLATVEHKPTTESPTSPKAERLEAIRMPSRRTSMQWNCISSWRGKHVAQSCFLGSGRFEVSGVMSFLRGTFLVWLSLVPC